MPIKGNRHAIANHGGIQLLFAGFAAGDVAAVTVTSEVIAGDLRTGDQSTKVFLGHKPTGPGCMSFTARLAALRGVDALKPDATPANHEGIAIARRGAADQLAFGRLWHHRTPERGNRDDQRNEKPADFPTADPAGNGFCGRFSSKSQYLRLNG
jgi:hypothetical protein